MFSLSEQIPGGKKHDKEWLIKRLQNASDQAFQPVEVKLVWSLLSRIDRNNKNCKISKIFKSTTKTPKSTKTMKTTKLSKVVFEVSLLRFSLA